MSEIHRGATLTPHFSEFLPGWVTQQPWYRAAPERKAGTPSMSPVGYFRFEDRAGEVGVETHLLTDGSALYQLPLTYRDAPLPGGSDALVATAEHSVLGTRWIYDGVADPVWTSELLRLINTETVSDPSGRRGVGPASARGRRLTATVVTVEAVRVEVVRVVQPGSPPGDPDIAGLVMGSWRPAGPDGPAVTGCLAVARTAAHAS